MICEERERLWASYERTLDDFCDCAEALSKSSRAALGSRIIAATAARDICVKARTVWENHLREHTCDENRKFLSAGASGGPSDASALQPHAEEALNGRM